MNRWCALLAGLVTLLSLCACSRPEGQAGGVSFAITAEGSGESGTYRLRIRNEGTEAMRIWNPIDRKSTIWDMPRGVWIRAEDSAGKAVRLGDSVDPEWYTPLAWESDSRVWQVVYSDIAPGAIVEGRFPISALFITVPSSAIDRIARWEIQSNLHFISPGGASGIVVATTGWIPIDRASLDHAPAVGHGAEEAAPAALPTPAH